MIVVHVINSLLKAAGTTVFCVELCDHLKQLGVNVRIAIPKGAASQELMQPLHDISILCLRSLDDITFKPDIIHVHALWNRFPHQACVFARKHKIPLVVSPHGMLTPWALNNRKWKKRFAWALYQWRDLRNADLFHATAQSEVDDIRRQRLDQSVIVAPLGVSVPPTPVTFRNNTPKIALFVSRLHPKKGLFNLVDAWAEVKNSKVQEFGNAKVGGAVTDCLARQGNSRTSPWRFVIAGPDQDGHAADVMVRAKAAGVDKDFEMVGPVFGKQKNDLYAKADLFVLPTYSENFGVVVIEALAYGCPVITTKGAPWQELLGKCEAGSLKTEDDSVTANSQQLTAFSSNGRCGWWIDMGVESLAKALKEAMSLSDEDRLAMGVNGRRLVESKYNWSAIAVELKKAYEWVIMNGPASDCIRLG